MVRMIRIRRGQSSIEFMLLLVAVAVVSLLALGAVNSQMSVQKEVHANASNLLEKSSLALANNLSAAASNPYAPNNGSGSEDETDIRLELATSQPYYANQTSVVQLVAWNYGGSAVTIPELLLQSNSSDIGFTPDETASALVGLSYTMTASITPKQAGTYLLSGKALDSAGIVMRNSDGQPVRVNSSIIVLSAPGSGGGDEPITALNYTITATRGNEQFIYSSSPATPSNIYSVTGCMNGATICATPWQTPECGLWSCDGGNINPGWCERINGGPYVGCVSFISTSDTCNMWGHKSEATARYILGNASLSFAVTLTVKNATNYSASVTITGPSQMFSLSEGRGNATMLGSPTAVSGTDPSATSILTAVPGTSTPGEQKGNVTTNASNWVLRSRNKFDEYARAESIYAASASFNLGKNFTGFGGGEGDIIFVNCGTLNAKASELLASTGATGCAVSEDAIKCSAVSVSYPQIKLQLSREFLGGQVPETNPQYILADNVTFIVYTD